MDQERKKSCYENKDKGSRIQELFDGKELLLRVNSLWLKLLRFRIWMGKRQEIINLSNKHLPIHCRKDKEKEFKDLWIVTHLSFLFFMLSFLNSLLRSVRNYFWIFIFSKIVPNPTKKELESDKMSVKRIWKSTKKS